MNTDKPKRAKLEVIKLSATDNKIGSPFICGILDRSFHKKNRSQAKPRCKRYVIINNKEQIKAYSKSQMTAKQIARYWIGYTNAVKIIKGLIKLQ